MEKAEHGKLHYVIAALLFLAGLVILLIFIQLRSQADSFSTSATVSNATPAIDNIYFNIATNTTSNVSSVTLTSDTRTKRYIWGTASDANGCEDITNDGDLLGTLTNLAPGSCDQLSEHNPQQCYISYYGSETAISCQLLPATCTSGGSDTTVEFECTINLDHFASFGDATWSAGLTVDDGTASSTPGAVANITFVSTSAANFSASSIAYGTIALGATSTDKTITVDNTGNDTDLDLAITIPTLTCTVGTLGASRQGFSTTTNNTFSTKTAGTGSAQTFNLSLNKQTATSTSSTASTYFQISLPSTGAGGSCTGTTTITVN